eukprot:2596288-Rhodomonas_salina.1
MAPRIDSPRIDYALSGTDPGNGTNMLLASRHAATPFALPCPVLTLGIPLRFRYAVSGTDEGCTALPLLPGGGRDCTGAGAFQRQERR